MDAYLGPHALKDCTIEMRMEFRIGRRIEEGSEGDDIILEGRKSHEFIVTGKLSMAQFREIEKMVSKAQPIFKSEFGEYKVAVKSMYYRGGSGDYSMQLVEDIC